jgi:hypothetical protein
MYGLSKALNQAPLLAPRGLLGLRQMMEKEFQKINMKAVDPKESSLVKYHFKKIVDGYPALGTLGAVKILDQYIEKSDNEVFVDLIRELKSKILSNSTTLQELYNFANAFLAQNYPIDIFYRTWWTTNPSSDDSDDEDEQLVADMEGLAIKAPKQLPSMPLIKDPKRQTIFMDFLDPESKQIQRDRQLRPRSNFYQTMKDLITQDCEFLYKKTPWVKSGLVNQVYVHPIKGDFYDVVDLEKFIMYDDEHYYQPKKKYYYLQCNSQKVQNGNILTIKKDGQTYELIVAVDTVSKGIVMQNEDMFRAELNYLTTWNSDKNKRISELEEDRPHELMILTAKADIVEAFQKAMKDNVPVLYRSSNGDFISTVVNVMLKNSDSGKSFVRLVANLVIFLNINISFVTCSVFVKRLREQVYLPGTLPFLTDADKLPEIFLNKNVPSDTKTFVLQKLEEERVNFTSKFFKEMYFSITMGREPTKPVIWYKPTLQVELPDIKTICKNRGDVEHENDEHLVFYTDMDEVYCFNVHDLYSRFKTDNTVNPYTNRPFSPKFIQTCLSRYASKSTTKPIEPIEMTSLMFELENIINSELTLLENRLIEKFQPSYKPETMTMNSVVEKCVECKSNVSDLNKVRTFFRNKEIMFCGYDCLEKNKSFK